MENKYDRSLVTKLQGSIIPLAIETGRFATVSLGKRTCKMCTNTDENVGDEMHFLFICDWYDLREILHKKILEAKSDLVNMLILDKLKILLNDYHKEITRFISNAYILRRGEVYNSTGY